MRVEAAPLTIPSHKPVIDGTKVKQKTDGELQKPTQPLVTEKEVIQAIERANKTLKVHGTHLEFSIHDKTKEIMVKVIDQETKEVIREIPPEKILDMVAKLWELAGILVDERR